MAASSLLDLAKVILDRSAGHPELADRRRPPMGDFGGAKSAIDASCLHRLMEPNPRPFDFSDLLGRQLELVELTLKPDTPGTDAPSPHCTRLAFDLIHDAGDLVRFAEAFRFDAKKKPADECLSHQIFPSSSRRAISAAALSI